MDSKNKIKNKHSYILRVISAFVAAAFVWQNLSWAVPEIKPMNTYNIPQELGKVGQFYHSGGDKTLILIQDAHTNFSAQQNISKILEDLLKTNKIDTAFVEGGTRDDSLTFLRPLASKTIREQVAKKYLLDGQIGGPEYLSLASDYDLKLQGVEDDALYNQNLAAYAAVAEKREESLSYLETIRQRVDSLKRQFYSSRLLEFSDFLEKFKKKEKEFGEYFDIVSQAAQDAGVNLVRYPQFLSLKKLKTLESQIDFNKANEELSINIAKDNAMNSLNQNERPTRLKITTDISKTILFYEKLLISSRAQNLSSDNLSHYVDYLRFSETLNMESLSKELEILEDDIFKHSLTGANAAALYETSKQIENLKKLFTLSANRDDFEIFDAAESDKRFQILSRLAFINRHLLNLGRDADAVDYRAVLEETKKPIKEFYRLTLERDEVMVRKAIQQMDRGHLENAALVVGGYHTQNITRLLKDNKISYMVVTPQVEAETNLKKYETILLSQLKNKPVVRLEKPEAGYLAPRAVVEMRPSIVLEIGRRLSALSGSRLAEKEPAMLSRRAFLQAAAATPLLSLRLRQPSNFNNVSPGIDAAEQEFRAVILKLMGNKKFVKQYPDLLAGLKTLAEYKIRTPLPEDRMDMAGDSVAGVITSKQVVLVDPIKWSEWGAPKGVVWHEGSHTMPVQLARTEIVNPIRLLYIALYLDKKSVVISDEDIITATVYKIRNELEALANELQGYRDDFAFLPMDTGSFPDAVRKSEDIPPAVKSRLLVLHAYVLSDWKLDQSRIAAHSSMFQSLVSLARNDLIRIALSESLEFKKDLISKQDFAVINTNGSIDVKDEKFYHWVAANAAYTKWLRTKFVQVSDPYDTLEHLSVRKSESGARLAASAALNGMIPLEVSRRNGPNVITWGSPNARPTDLALANRLLPASKVSKDVTVTFIHLNGFGTGKLFTSRVSNLIQNLESRLNPGSTVVFAGEDEQVSTALDLARQMNTDNILTFTDQLPSHLAKIPQSHMVMAGELTEALKAQFASYKPRWTALQGDTEGWVSVFAFAPIASYVQMIALARTHQELREAYQFLLQIVPSYQPNPQAGYKGLSFDDFTKQIDGNLDMLRQFPLLPKITQMINAALDLYRVSRTSAYSA